MVRIETKTGGMGKSPTEPAQNQRYGQCGNRKVRRREDVWSGSGDRRRYQAAL